MEYTADEGAEAEDDASATEEVKAGLEAEGGGGVGEDAVVEEEDGEFYCGDVYRVDEFEGPLDLLNRSVKATFNS